MFRRRDRSSSSEDTTERRHSETDGRTEPGPTEHQLSESETEQTMSYGDQLLHNVMNPDWADALLPWSTAPVEGGGVVEGSDWTMAATERLQRALSTQAAFPSNQKALQALLDRVDNDRFVTEKELLTLLHEPSINNDALLEEVDNETKSAEISATGDSELEEEGTVEKEKPRRKRHTKRKLLHTMTKLVTDTTVGAGNDLGGYVGFVLEHKLVQSHLFTVVDWVLKKLQDQWRHLLYHIFPLQHIQTLFFICVVQLISVDRIMRTLPLLICYASFVVLVYFTLNMFRGRVVGRQVESWHRLLAVFKPTDNESAANMGDPSAVLSRSVSSPASGTTNEDQLQPPAVVVRGASAEPHASPSPSVVAGVDPYTSFFVALFVFILAFAFGDKALPNSLLLGALSGFFTLFTFVMLPDHLDWMAVVAMLLNLISSLPGLLTRKLGMAKWRVLQPWLVLRVSYFKLNIGLPSLALFCVPLVYATLAITQRTRANVYRILVPQLVCYLWSELTITLLLAAGPLSLQLDNLLLTIGVVSLFVWPSGFGIALVSGVVVARLRETISFLSCLKAIVTALILLSPLIYKKLVKIAREKYGWGAESSSSGAAPQRNVRTLALLGFYVCLVLMTVAALYHGRLGLAVGGDRHISNLTWTDFEQQCGSQMDAEANRIDRQIACSELKGVSVSWKGSVQTAKIVKVDNSLETLLQYLPEGISDSLKCFYGRKLNDDEWPARRKRCTLSDQHSFSFEVEVSGPFGRQLISSAKGSLLLVGSHVFRQMLPALQEGDVVNFVAYFDDYPIFRHPPRLRLIELRCVTCKGALEQQRNRRNGDDGDWSKRDRIVVRDLAGNLLWNRLFFSFKFLFNFLFAPAVVVPTD